MRKQIRARIVAFVLTLVMLLSTLPVEAFAAGFGPLTGSSAEYNEALLTQLQALCTDGQDATQILDTLREHGLVDDEGFPVFGDTFDVDGTVMTDAELTAAALQHEDSEALTIDGVESTWGQIKTLLAIRQSVNELQSFMNTGVSAAQASTPAYQAAMESLTTQLYSGGGLTTFSAGAVFGAGINHQTRVSVSAPATLYENGGNQTAQLTASIPAALSYPVSFDYLAVSGSAMASGSGTATIPAGSTSVSFSVTYVRPTDPEQDQWESSGRHYYYVELSNLKNALFGNNGASMTVEGAVAGRDDLNLTKTYTSSKYGTAIHITSVATVGYETLAFPLSAVGLNAKYSWDITATLQCKMMRTSAATGFRDCTYFSDSASEAPTAGQDIGEYIDSVAAAYCLDDEGSRDTNVDDATVDSAPTLTISRPKKRYSGAETSSVSFYDYYGCYQFVTIFAKNVYGRTWAKLDLVCTPVIETVGLEEITIPDGTFYAGQQVPIRVRFKSPVELSDGITLTLAEGTALHPVESGMKSNACTFLYTVPQLPSGSLPGITSLTFNNVKSLGGQVCYDTNDSGKTGTFNIDMAMTNTSSTIVKSNNNCKLRNNKLSALRGFTASIDDAQPTLQYVTVTIPLTDSDTTEHIRLKKWLTTATAQEPITKLELATRTDLLPGSEVQEKLPAYSDATKYAIERYATGLYLSPDGGTHRYPLYLVAQKTDNTETNELPVALVAYYKPVMNVTTEDRTDTVELFMDPDIASTANYFTATGTDLDAPLVLSLMGDGVSASYGSYVVKHAVFVKPGSASVDYTTDNPFLSNWSAIASPSDLLSYSQKLDAAENVVLDAQGHPVYVDGSGAEHTCVAATDTDAATPTDATVSLISDNAAIASQTSVRYVVADTPITGDFRVDEDELVLNADFSAKEYTFLGTDNLIWVSSDETVANVETRWDADSKVATAVITPTGKAGKAHFTLYALNYGIDGFTPVEVCQSIDLLCSPGYTPFLKIPSHGQESPKLLVRQGCGLDVCFTSNVTAINAAMCKTLGLGYEAYGKTVFTMDVYAADADGQPTGESLSTVTATSTDIDTIGRLSIPAEVLMELSDGDKAAYVAVVKVTSLQMQEDAGVMRGFRTPEVELTAQTGIQVIPNPAKVTLDKLPSYSVQDTETLTLGCNAVSSDGAFATSFTITGSDGTVVKDFGALAEGHNEGAWTPESVTDCLKKAYVVSASITLFEGEAPTTDSYVVYVYNSHALDILVDAADGKAVSAAGSRTDVDEVTLDNHAYIESLVADGPDGKTIDLGEGAVVTLADLMQDVNLKAMLGINYGDYVWGQLSDQIKWVVTDVATGNTGTGENLNDITPVTMNYEQGGAYSNITTYAYTSYSPSDKFMAVGLKPGTVELTATHAENGMTSTITIHSKNLENQLYLFQFVPKAETTVTYKNGKGETCSVKSNAQGELALYEPSGIPGNVQLYSLVDGAAYIGTIANKNLVTSEQDISKLQTYPVNNYRLREVATVKLYVKDENGAPYAGKTLTVRGGVYKNGVYCPAARLGDARNDLLDGKEDQTFVTDSKGMMTVYLDSSQFYDASELTIEDRTIDGADKLEYIFELKFTADGDKYQPQMIHIDANSDEKSVAKAGDTIVTARPVVTGVNTAVINRQLFDNIDKTTRTVAETHNVYGKTDAVGISYQYPTDVLRTEVLLWGSPIDTAPLTMVDGENTLQLGTQAVIPEDKTEQYDMFYWDINDYQPLSQRSEVITYPFADMPVVLNTWTMKKAEVDRWVPNADDIGLRAVTFIEGAVTKTEANSFRASNTSDTDPITDDKMNAAEGNAMSAVSSNMSPGAMFSSMESDDKTSPAFTLLGGLQSEKGLPIGIVLSPTEDPNTFHAVVTIGHANGSNSQAGDGDWNKKQDGKGSGKTDNGGSYDSGYKDPNSGGKEEQPDPFEMKMGPATLTIGGYMMCNIGYNKELDTWALIFVGGGFQADLGISKEWSKNFMVGPVPATISFKIGADLTLDFGAAITYLGDEMGNDFLTQIGVIGYVEAFAGVGFDAGVVAIKLGVFGRIEVGTYMSLLNKIDWADGGDLTTKIANKTGITGTIGLRFTCKILLVSYETTFASKAWEFAYTTEEWNNIEEYWQGVTTGQGRSFTGYSMGGGTVLYTISDALMESRGYLEDNQRYWSAAAPAMMALDDVNLVSTLQFNAYPFAEPQYNSDGSLVVFLSDQDSTDLQDTAASWARRSDGGYIDQKGISPVTYKTDELHNDTGAAGADGKLDPVYDAAGHVINRYRKTERTGYGDTGARVAGTADFSAAVWVRQMDDLGKRPGESASYDDLSVMMNGTEIYASVYVGGAWSTVALTDNTTPDLSPAVAVSGRRAIVAWRSVSASSAENPMEFNTADNLLCRIYDSGSWSEPVMLYNGETGTINGLQAAMTPDGAAIVGYTIKTGEDDNVSTDTDTMYTVVGGDNAVVRSVRITNDDDLDQNVRAAAVTWNGESCFILGWYNESDPQGAGSETGSLSADIHLAAISAESGLPRGDFVESVSAAGAEGITRNFRFSAPASGATLDSLSVIWQQSVSDGADTATGTSLGMVPTGTETLQAVKFYQAAAGSAILVTRPIEVAAMGRGESIDSFSAYNEGTNRMHAVLQSTSYELDMGDPATYTVDTITQTVGMTASGTELTRDVNIYTPVGVTSMCTATGTYPACAVEVAQPAIPAESVMRGMRVPVQFMVTNSGAAVIRGETITLGGAAQQFDTVILPGQTAAITALYEIPETGVLDVTYAVSASSDGALSAPAVGTLVLNRPDVAILDMTVVEEENRSRTVSVSLGNSSDVPLENGGKTVTLALYGSDADRRTDDALHSKAITVEPISANGALALMDANAYTWRYTLDDVTFAEMLAKQFTDEDIIASEGEIPSRGVMLFARAWVTDGSDTELVQTNEMDNASALTMYSLLGKNGGKPTTMSTRVALNGDVTTPTDITSADVIATLRNNSYADTTNGNVVTALLDRDGNVISTVKQTYSKTIPVTHGLLQLEEEAREDHTLRFLPGDMLEGHSLSEAVTAYALYSNVDEDDVSALLTVMTARGQKVSVDAFEKAIATVKPSITKGSATIEDPASPTDTKRELEISTYYYSTVDTMAFNILKTAVTAIPNNPGDNVRMMLNGACVAEGEGAQLVGSTLSRYGNSITMTVTGSVYTKFVSAEDDTIEYEVNDLGKPVFSSGTDILEVPEGEYTVKYCQNVRNYTAHLSGETLSGGVPEKKPVTGLRRSVTSDNKLFTMTEGKFGSLRGAQITILQDALGSTALNALEALLSHNGFTYDAIDAYRAVGVNGPADPLSNVTYKAGKDYAGKTITLLQYTPDGILYAFTATANAKGAVVFKGVGDYGAFLLTENMVSANFTEEELLAGVTLNAIPPEDMTDALADGSAELTQEPESTSAAPCINHWLGLALLAVWLLVTLLLRRRMSGTVRAVLAVVAVLGLGALLLFGGCVADWIVTGAGAALVVTLTVLLSRRPKDDTKARE